MEKAIPKNHSWSREEKFYLFFFLVAVLGGAIRKWFVTDNLIGNLVLLVQMLFPFILYFFRSSQSKDVFSTNKILVFYFAYLVFQIINPFQLTLFHGILGVMTHGGFWLGIFYYLANRKQFKLQKLMPWFFACAIGETILGFIQYALPGDHFLNKYANEEIIENIAIVGDSVRITGSFSYLAGFNAFLFFYAFVFWALIRLKYPQWLFILFLLSGIILTFMSGSRSGTLIYLGICGLAILMEFPFNQVAKMLFRLILPGTIVFALLILSGDNPVSIRAQKAADNFIDRVSKLNERGEQAKRYTLGLDRFNNTDQFVSPIIGIGTGAVYQGATILFGKSSYVIQFGYIESEFVQIILEGGIIIFLFRVFLATALVFNLPFSKLMRFFLWICLMYAMPITFNVHNATFLSMGLMLIDSIIYHQKIIFLEIKSEE